jgi:hypothetical protein
MFTILSHSEPGGHADNQDAFAVQAHPLDPGCLLCAVADGQGGRVGGGPAARLACRACVEAAGRRPPGALFHPCAWAALGRAADEAVVGDTEAGLTTLVALAVRGDELAGASSGDSAAVLVSGGRPPVVLTARQWKDPPVGSGAAVFRAFEGRLAAPWAVLALTDGVWKYAGWEAVLSAAQGPAEAAVAGLRGRAALPGSGRLQDDFTLVLVRG